jgi:hypothetical protein
MKMLTAAAFASLALVASPMVLAQTTSSPPSKTSPPSTSSPSTPTQPKAAEPKTTTPNAMAPKSADSKTTGSKSMQPAWYTHQPGEMRASKLIGTSVVNDANEDIGDINELVLTKDGNIAAVVIGVGGFLGLGEREVAVRFDSLRLSQDKNQRAIVKLGASRDELKSAPQWKWTAGDRSGTTGSGTTKPAK